MATSRRLADLYTVGKRFRRSVNLAADLWDADALAGFVHTALSHSVLARVAGTMIKQGTGGAWSITGPYGAGKSASLLFVGRVLGNPVDQEARSDLAATDAELARRLADWVGPEGRRGLCVVPVVGSHQPLASSLLDALAEAAAAIASEDDPAPLAAKLAEAAASAREGHPPSPDEVVAWVETAATHLADHRGALGVLIVYDELGRTLEYHAGHPEQGGIGLLQSLAELATRSREPVIGLITVLHQAFERYASALSPREQREWAKIQGRFEDIGFLASPAEFLALLAEAIKPTQAGNELTEAYDEEIVSAAELGLTPPTLSRDEGLRLLQACLPLHPTVALLLVRLFRSGIAQNERSLFAFLSSGEPYAFQEFLATTTFGRDGDKPLYRVDRLYAYVTTALGSRLYLGRRGKRWAEIADALDRLPPDASPIDAALTKAIGMLTLLGDQQRLRPSAKVLAYAVGYPVAEVEEALARLSAWGVVTYRRYQDAYVLWEGSDVDLDTLWERGMAQISRRHDLASLLRDSGRLKPYVAKRHLHETGTLRYLVPWVVTPDELPSLTERSLGDADGAVVYVVGSPGADLAALAQDVHAYTRKLREPRRSQLLFALPRRLEGLREAYEERLVWQWVAAHTPALEGDSVARRELAARRLNAERRLKRALEATFSMAAGHAACRWIWRGEERTFPSGRALTRFVSTVCDQVYYRAPIVKNELMNRRSLSSAAAAARRELIERLLLHEDQAGLGMEGTPPAMSAYLSLLHASGLHRQVDGQWRVGLPPPDDPYHLRPTWDAIVAWMQSTQERARPVTELYDLLRAPPYGLKDGLLPVYFTAVYVALRDEIALYENDTFVPEPGPPEFERLLRVPQRFALRCYPFNDTAASLLRAYATLFTEDLPPERISLLAALRPLIAFVKALPQHTRLTRRLPSQALDLLEAVTTAREPQPLLLETLPELLLGCDAQSPAFDLDVFVRKLRRALGSLQAAYPRLLERIQRRLLDGLLLPQDLATAREQIRKRALLLDDAVQDVELKPFVTRLADDKLPHTAWIASVAAVVVHKPPHSWADADEDRFRVALHELTGRFRRTEETMLDGDKGTAGDVVRLAVTGVDGREARELLRPDPEIQPAVWDVVERLEGALERLPGRSARLQALAELARRLLDAREEEATDG